MAEVGSPTPRSELDQLGLVGVKATELSHPRGKYCLSLSSIDLASSKVEHVFPESAHKRVSSTDAHIYG